MNNRRAAVVRVAMCSFLVSVCCGVCAAQDFGTLPEAKHRVRVSCLGDDIPAFCDLLGRQLKKLFPVTKKNVQGTYTVHVGGQRASDAVERDPYYVVYAILTRSVVYQNDVGGDPKVANHFRKIHTTGTLESDFLDTAKVFADTIVQNIRTDIAKIQR